MVHLVLLDLAVDLDILEALIEIFLDLLHIVVAGALGLFGLVKFRHLLLNVAHEAFILKLSGFVLPLQLLRLRSVLHELSGIIVVIALQLLQLSLLLLCLQISLALHVAHEGLLLTVALLQVLHLHQKVVSVLLLPPVLLDLRKDVEFLFGLLSSRARVPRSASLSLLCAF